MPDRDIISELLGDDVSVDDIAGVVGVSMERIYQVLEGKYVFSERQFGRLLRIYLDRFFLV